MVLWVKWFTYQVHLALVLAELQESVKGQQRVSQ